MTRVLGLLEILISVEAKVLRRGIAKEGDSCDEFILVIVGSERISVAIRGEELVLVSISVEVELFNTRGKAKGGESGSPEIEVTASTEPVAANVEVVDVIGGTEVPATDSATRETKE